MRCAVRLFTGSLTLALLGAGLASAQAIDFSLLASPSNGNPQTISNNGTIQLVANNVGAQTSVTLVATYTGATQATISALPQLIGSTAMVLSVPSTETFPLVLTRSQTLTFTVTYTAAASSQVSASLSIPYSEPSSTGGMATNSINLLFEGFAPAFTLSYILASDNNVIPLAPGGTITFTPPTQINTTAQAQLNISDTGSGPGSITGVSLVSGGPVFKISGVPLFPYPLTPGTSTASLPIGILYSPTAVEADTGQIKITYQDGTSATVNLSGNGATSSYTYSYISTGTKAITVKSGDTITLPAVPVATTGTTAASSSVILTVTNSGNANGTINSINATGPFGISGQPNAPPTLKPGDSESFTITYTPTQVGNQKGTLVVGNDTFTLSGTGSGPELTFSYVSGGATVSLGTSGEVVFPAIAVSQSEKVTFTVTNSGTTTATIALITTNSPFSVPLIPPIPLAAGQSTTFPITFAPTVVGPVTGSLLVNTSSLSLVGAGTAPPALPSYTISGPSGTVSPASQANVSLTLSKSFPVDLNGVLTLTTSGDLGTDPSVQFSTGSTTGNRTVDFVIPANTTSADFAGQGSQILLQTGTVAETVTLTPSFATTGGVDVTPASPATLQFTVAPAAPVEQSVQVTNVSASSFTVLIVGYTTTRSLASLNITFNAASGYNLSTTTFTEDLSGASAVWFQSSASQAFGGLFQVTVPFTLTGPVANGKTLVQAIASISATVSNSVGASNSLQAIVTVQ